MNTNKGSQVTRSCHRPEMKENWRKKMPATATLEGQMVKSGRRGQSDLPLSKEQDLIVQARNGSPAAIELLVSRCDSRLFRLARNITFNHEDAEEVVQNAFVKAFQNLSAIRSLRASSENTTGAGAIAVAKLAGHLLPSTEEHVAWKMQCGMTC
jgi:hypothetical protein